MRELDKIAEKLFDKIRTRFENVNLGDDKVKQTADPTKARFFNFDYIGAEGKNFGNVTISIVDETGLKIYFSKNITDALEDQDQDEWFDFLKSVRKFARSNMLSFDVRDINKSNLDLRDLKQQSKADSTFTDKDVTMTESRMWGTSRSSYQEMGPAKIIVRHSANINDDVHGARSRNIESVFIENHLGERRLLDFKNLHGARAMARHVSEGGSIDDEFGNHITEIVHEMNSMAHFVREAKRRQFEDTETDQMAKAAVGRYGELKNRLRHLGGRRGYDSYKMEYTPSESVEDVVDVDALRERFVKKIYDDRFNEALPYVYRAFKEQQQRVHTPMGEEFENWANELAEDSFESDDQERQVLEKLMSKPLQVGQDGLDAQHAIEPLFSDESLVDELTKLARANGPDTDARQTVLDWMKQNGMSIVAGEMEEKLAQQNPASPPPPAPAAEPAVQPTGVTTDAAPVAEDADLAYMRRLAGLSR